MTLAQQCQFRYHKLKEIPMIRKWFDITADRQLMGYCHWQRDRQQCPTVILIHGFEGSGTSTYILGLTFKAWKAGFNVVRLNFPGIEEHDDLKATLSDSDVTKDVCGIIRKLSQVDGLGEIWLVGYSLGGNLALRIAGEEGSHQTKLKGVAAVSPIIDPACSIQALKHGNNWIYNRFFVRRLRNRLRKKAKLCPERNLNPLPYRFNNLSEFIEEYAPLAGKYKNTDEYYEQLGAKHVLNTIQVPTLILASQDDPLVPFGTFSFHTIQKNPWITFIATSSGGHCSFIQAPQKHEDTYWAENRVIEFLTSRNHPSSLPSLALCASH